MDIESFIQKNEQSICSWTKVAKKLISQSKRKQLKEKNPVRKYFHKLISTPIPTSPVLDKLLKDKLTQNKASYRKAIESLIKTCDWNRKTDHHESESLIQHAT